jgi:DNA helicase-2/ATP-dependent DNA helicase PcrA
MEGSALLHSNAKIKDKITVREFSNYKFELLHLAEDIKNTIESGVLPSQIAVLYRANKNVSDIKTIFDFYQIPYTIFSKDKILDDPNIRNLIHILKVVLNPNDDHNLGKALFADLLKLDSYDIVRILDKYKSLRKEEKKHIFAILEDKKILKEIEVKNIEDFSNLAQTLKELKTESLNKTFPDFFKIFLAKIGYIKHMLSSPDSRLQLVKIDKLMDEIKRQNQSKKEYGLDDFIYFVDAFAKYNLDINSTDPETISGVSLMTAHGSKGREFEYVYIINATRRSWEGSRGAVNSITLPIYQYDGDVEDERRLFYVAMTRAKKHLNISFSRTDNDGREHEESEFVKEISESSKEEKNMKDFEEKNIEKLNVFLSAGKNSVSLFEPKYLRELFFRRGLNVSALNNYLNCPKRYLYKNLIRIPDAYSPTLQFGDLIHKSLQVFFQASSRAEEILPKNILLQAFEKELLKTRFSDKDEDKFRKRGEEALSLYYDEYSGAWGYRVKTEFHAERNFELDNKEILKLTGFVDKIEENDEDSSVNIVDYKTGRAFSEKSKEEKTDYERQIVFYHLLLEKYDENFSINKSTLDFIEKNKKGKFEQYSFEVTKEHLKKLREEINTCADEVLSMEFLKKGCGKKDCEWCQLEK